MIRCPYCGSVMVLNAATEDPDDGYVVCVQESCLNFLVRWSRPTWLLAEDLRAALRHAARTTDDPELAQFAARAAMGSARAPEQDYQDPMDKLTKARCAHSE